MSEAYLILEVPFSALHASGFHPWYEHAGSVCHTSSTLCFGNEVADEHWACMPCTSVDGAVQDTATCKHRSSAYAATLSITASC